MFCVLVCLSFRTGDIIPLYNQTIKDDRTHPTCTLKYEPSWPCNKSLTHQQGFELQGKLPATMKPLRVKLAVGGMYISSHPQQRKYSFSPPLFMVAMLNLPHVRKKSRERLSSYTTPSQHITWRGTSQPNPAQHSTVHDSRECAALSARQITSHCSCLNGYLSV